MKRKKRGIKMFAAVLTIGMLFGAPAATTSAHHNYGNHSDSSSQKTYCSYHKKYHKKKTNCKKYCTTHNKTHGNGKKHC